MYKNGKMRSVETVLRLGERRIKENDGRGRTLQRYKHFCKCHNAPPVNNMIINNK
jgi:hypothetical protein